MVTRSLDRDILPQLEADQGCQQPCTAFGAHDLDGRGRDELEIADTTPATGDAVMVYRLTGRTLAPLKLRYRPRGRAQLMELSYTGSATMDSWVVCRDTQKGRRVVQVGQGYPTSVDHRVFVSETVYGLKGLFFHHLLTRTYSRASDRVGSSVRVRGRAC
jgi:hypothetical protein